MSPNTGQVFAMDILFWSASSKNGMKSDKFKIEKLCIMPLLVWDEMLQRKFEFLSH